MNTLQAIYLRHSSGSVLPDPVPREIIEQLLSAAMQAPNHFKVFPWRFVVLQGAARGLLGDALALALRRRAPDAPPEAYEKERQKPFRAPVIITVISTVPPDSRVMEIENISAAAAATQNLLLAAADLGLAAKWRTGAGAYEPEAREFYGCLEGEHIIASVYLGYPAVDTPVPSRPGFEAFTAWME